MTIVPVIDLMQGRAVHARRGLRAAYRPLESPLCAEGEVRSLVRRLIEDFPFDTIYIADLDAIQGVGNNIALLTQIAADFPHLTIWLDGGFPGPTALIETGRHLGFRAVIGSESWRDTTWQAEEGTILSVDIGAEGLRDPSGICRDSERRPESMILMKLESVGAQQGPDFELLRHWCGVAPGSKLYAAGGVRNIADLHRLRTAGAAGALVASALHSGGLSPVDLAGLS